MTAYSSEKHAVLLAWISVNHLEAPFLPVPAWAASVLHRPVKKLYLCYRDAPPPDGDRERGALEKTKEHLRRKLAPKCPDLIPLPWKTGVPPTDHAAILDFAEGVLQKVRQENPDAEILIHLSPGTPAMHAVWLVLGSTAWIGGEVALIQTADERARATGAQPVERVSVQIDTWIRRFRSSSPKRSANDDDGHLWDPAKLKSPKLLATLKQLEAWAPLRVPVLLVGERGTGKTTMAHFLRSVSPFQKKAKSGVKEGWPVIVCGQFGANPELARSELFGHVRGAFTGANHDRVGLIEEANGDSLFLDEIADLDRGTQRLLMAALEGRGFHRLGEQTFRCSTFRLISATNRPLAELRGKLLDEDFFDRVGVFILEVPPLRECKEDLHLIWRETLMRAKAASAVEPEGWERYLAHQETLAQITKHRLQGNIRDLQRAAFHLLAVLPSRPTEEKVQAVLKNALDAGSSIEDKAGATLSIADLRAAGGLRAWLDSQRKDWLLAAMRECDGNKTKAADLLGLPRKTFENWLSEKDGER